MRPKQLLTKRFGSMRKWPTGPGGRLQQRGRSKEKKPLGNEKLSSKKTKQNKKEKRGKRAKHLPHKTRKLGRIKGIQRGKRRNSYEIEAPPEKKCRVRKGPSQLQVCVRKHELNLNPKEAN